MEEVVIRSGYRPGAIGRITELHAAYYSAHWGFDLFFESLVARGLAEFLERFDPGRDGFWLALAKELIVGAIAIDGREAQGAGARLRWFIVEPGCQGGGIGGRLIAEALGFCRRMGCRRVYLSTFAGLDAARHLYEAMGFSLVEECEGGHWGKRVREQTFELRL